MGLDGPAAALNRASTSASGYRLAARAPPRSARDRAAAAPVAAAARRRCRAEQIASPTPEKVVGTVPRSRRRPSRAVQERRPGRRQGGLRERRLRGLPHPGGRRHDRHRRPEPRRGEAAALARRRPRDQRRRRDAVVQGQAQPTSRSPTSPPTSSRRPAATRTADSSSPPTSRATSASSRRTSTARSSGRTASLRPRTIAAMQRARAAGLHVIVVTGRMVQSVRRVARAGRARTSRSSATRAPSSPTRDGDVAAARADPARARARGDRARSRPRATSPNVYVDDELYVARVDAEARATTPTSSTSTSTSSATLLDWLERAADEARLRRRAGRARRASSCA